MLNEIRKTHQIFLFSNTNDIHYRSFTSDLEKKFGSKNFLDSIFEKTYFSHLVEKRKPNADAFQLVIQEQGLDPNRTLFIDDSEQHIKGAQLLGIQTYHLVDEDLIDIFNPSKE